MPGFTRESIRRIGDAVRAVEGADLVQRPDGTGRGKGAQGLGAQVQLFAAPGSTISAASIASGKITTTVASVEKLTRGEGADAGKWVPSGLTFDVEHISTTEDIPTTAHVLIVVVVEGVRTIVGWECP